MSASDSLASFTDSLLNAAPPTAFSAASSFLKSEAAFFDNVSAWLTSRVEAEHGFVSRLSLGLTPKTKHGKNDDQVILPPSLIAFRAAFFEREGGEIQAAHERFRVRVENEVIPSLRSEDDWARVRTLQNSVEKVVRDYEDCQSKLVKAQKKLDSAAQGSKASSTARSKVVNLEAELAGVMHNYASVAPGLYGLAESIHKKHLLRLKEAFASFQTIQSDLARERMEIAEKGLVDCLALDSQAVIQEWQSIFVDEFGVCRPSTVGFEAGNGLPVPDLPENQQASHKTSEPNASANTYAASLTQPPHLSQRDRSPLGDRLDISSDQPPTRAYGALTDEFRDDAASSRSIKSVNRKSLVPSLLRRKSKSHAKSTQWVPQQLSPEPEESLVHNSPDAAQPNSTNGDTRQNLLDSDGFTVPPEDRDKAPWQASDPGDTLEAVSDTGAAIPLPKVSQIAITPSEVSEDNGQRDVALERMKSTLLSAKSHSTIGRRQTTRGRRDMKTTTLASGENPTVASGFTSSPLTTPTKNDRTFSIISSSTPSVLSFEHHEPPPIGFHAWCTERCHAKVDMDGNLHVSVLGSIAFSARGIDNMAPTTSIALKDASLAKIVPNPTLLTSTVEDSWLLNMAALEKYCNSNLMPSPAFKYQLNLDSTSPDNMLAVACQTAWKTEPTLTSLIISLQRQPRSSSEGSLEDVSVTAPISSNVISHQAKPHAIWKPEERTLMWKLGSLNSADASLRLLARVVCDSPDTLEPISVRWQQPGTSLSGVTLEVDNSHHQLDSFKKQVIGHLDVASSTST